MSPKPPQDSRNRPSNRLGNESSAYLRQHRHNPVDWYPWGDAAFERARSEDKPLLISIGYSACHWCHVMERESFENPEIAELMNELFVSIKVDREERPDIDQIYMDTLTRLTGHGGWPLTVFCMPDGSPFYAGTYFPPDDRANLPGFPTVLRAIDDAYRNRNDEVRHSCGEILEALRDRPQGTADGQPGAEVVARAAEQVLAGADVEHGGFGSGPKFPTPGNLELLLSATDFVEAERASELMKHCLLSCQEMSRRGLYDHLGGGFHRYCVDGSWTIPHFEKMLYDQGLLLRVYLETWRRAGASHPDLEWPIRETAEYLRRELGPPEAGFAASQDADSEAVEGRFYVWTPSQLGEVLGDDAEPFGAAYSVTERGNFEHGTSQLVDRERAPRDRFRTEREKLFTVRADRIAPDTDPKRVAAWNGFAISGLARAGSLLGDPQLCDDAIRAADFVLEHMRLPDGGLARIHAAGRASVPAFLDDHAAMLDACLDLYRAGCGERFLSAAFEFGGAIATRFFETAEQDLFLTPSDGEKLVHRPRSDHDGATPHATGLAVLGLERLAELGERSDLRDVVDAVIATHALQLERAPQAFPTLVRAVALRARGLSVAVVVGTPGEASTEALAARARLVLLPEDAVVVAAPGSSPPTGIAASWLEGRDVKDGRATAYVCRGQTCSLPVVDPAELRPLAGL